MLPAVKTDEQRRARELRAQGRSVGDIQQELGVSRSSASTWVRDVELTAEQRTRLIARTRLGPIVAGPKKAAAPREVRRKNKLPHGTGELIVTSTQIVQTIYGSIQEYGGFERPEWLD